MTSPTTSTTQPSTPPAVSDQIPTPSLGTHLIGAEEESLVLEVLRSRSLFRYYGPNPTCPPRMVATLESEYRALIGARFALGVTSGTAALEVALAALGIGPGDEVILPAWSWVSCFTAIVRVGGTPVLAEIDATLCLDPDEIARLKTPRTKAVLVVHFQGVAARMEEILAEAAKAGISVLEDCAESPGALYRGKRVGSMGLISIFSFQQQKSITSGEGGMVMTNDPRLYERAVRMHDLGQFRDFHGQQTQGAEPAFCGDQFRMSELTGAVALAQLRKLDALRGHCRSLTSLILPYVTSLRGLTLRDIPDPTGDSGFELYFWLKTTELRDAFRARLQEEKIPCLQMTGTYAQYRRAYVHTGLTHALGSSPFPMGANWPTRGYRAEDFPRTEALIHRFIAIPVGANYTEAHAEIIGRTIRRIHDELGLG